jgi:hypothetical protein
LDINYGMKINRRAFLGLGSLITCGTILHPGALFAATQIVLKNGLPLRDGDGSVFDFVKKYSSNFRVVGASVLGRIRTSGLRTLHIIAEVADLSQMQGALANAPFSEIFSHDNTLSFVTGEIDVTIENLLPDVFAARLASMLKRGGNAFAHDALAYNPETQQLSDPFHARVGGLRIVNKTFGGPAALNVVLRGTLEASQMGLQQSEAFIQWKRSVLRLFARSDDAQKLVELFLQQLSTFAEKLPTQNIEKILKSHLVASAFKQVFGVDVVEIIAEFAAMRPTLDAEFSNAALWIALLLKPEIESNAFDGAATTWIQNGNRFHVLRSRVALAKARELIST